MRTNNPEYHPVRAALRLIGLLAVCMGVASAAVPDPRSAPVHALVFDEFEPGVGNSVSRIMITGAYLRIDDNLDGGDFVLFDRDRRLVTSVSHVRRQLFDIHRRDADTRIPASVGLRELITRKSGSGEYAGFEVASVRFVGGGQVCGGAEIVEGYADSSRVGLLDYYRALAGNNAADLLKTPAELRTPCFYINNIYAQVRALELGLPIAIWRADGRRRVLTGASRREYEPRWFELPDYPRYSFSAPGQP